jgi:selenocysteine-specific elongation factor
VAAAAQLQPVPADLLHRHGLTRTELTAAIEAKLLFQVAGGYLERSAIEDAVNALRGLPQPFSVSLARKTWHVNRTTALALLQHLDQTGVTDRHNDGSRQLRGWP